MTFRILGIAGSLRRASFNRGLLAAAAEEAPDGVELEIVPLDDLPPYNADFEGERSPAPVVALREHIAAADALLIATPEYNTSVPGVLKNAVDWASRPFPNSSLRGKPVAIMGAGGRFGTVRAQGELRSILTALGCYVLPWPQIPVISARERFDEDGNLTDDDVRNGVRMLVEQLVSWAGRVRPD